MLDIKPFQTNPLPVNLMEGDNSSLECITGESSPPAQIYWERNSEIFTGGTQINSTFKTFIPYGLIGQFYMKLVLIGSPVNSGMFNCVARNKALGIEVKSLKVFFNVTGMYIHVYLKFGLKFPEKIYIFKCAECL